MYYILYIIYIRTLIYSFCGLIWDVWRPGPEPAGTVCCWRPLQPLLRSQRHAGELQEYLVGAGWLCHPYGKRGTVIPKIPGDVECDGILIEYLSQLCRNPTVFGLFYFYVWNGNWPRSFVVSSPCWDDDPTWQLAAQVTISYLPHQLLLEAPLQGGTWPHRCSMGWSIGPTLVLQVHWDTHTHTVYTIH